MSTEYSYGYLFGVAGLILAGISVYYARAQHKRETTEPRELKDSEDTVTIESRNKVLDTFD